jgi:hypothetical protein
MEEILSSRYVPGCSDLFRIIGNCLITFQAWEKSTAKDWCLSETCLTGRKAQSALRDYLQQDSTLHEEIQVQCGKVEGLDSDSVPAEADIEDYAMDDSDIPLREVISDTVGLDLPPHIELNSNTAFLVTSVIKDAEGGLVPGADDEDVWSYNDMGEKWAEMGEIILGEENNE